LFRAARRSFCKRLLEAAAAQPEIHRAEINLAAATCQIEFGPGLPTSQALAGAFVAALRQAASSAPRGDRTRWWQRLWGWSTLTAFRLPDGVSVWETVEVKPGRVRLRNRGLEGDRARLSRLADSLAGLDGVDGCCVFPLAHRVTIDYRPENPLANRLLDRVEQVLESLKAAGLRRAEPLTLAPFPDGDTPVVAGTVGKRLAYLALAGGAFAITLMGRALPWFPTAPWLFTTSAYLARSSPRLNERLRRTALFAPTFQDWERDGGSSWSSKGKGKLTGLTLTITVVTLVLAPLTPVTLVLIVFVSSLSIYGIARMPALPEEPPSRHWLGGRPRLSLPPL
jgi:uncharacterized membrane protein YbaN (DUF454 family)